MIIHITMDDHFTKGILIGYSIITTMMSFPYYGHHNDMI